MHDNMVCTHVGYNAPVAKVGGTCNNNVASADHWQIFIHHENIWYYVIQTQLKTASDHSLRTQKFQKFPGEHAQTYIGGLSPPPPPTPPLLLHPRIASDNIHD